MLICMKRTTLVLDPDLMRELKTQARKAGITFKEQVHQLLREGLRAMSSKPQKKYTFKPPTGRGKILPGVDLSNHSALIDLMEGRK